MLLVDGYIIVLNWLARKKYFFLFLFLTIIFYPIIIQWYIYEDIINNYWGGKNPSKDNGQLIEWMPLFVPNKHHSDSDPLTMGLRMDGTALVGETVTATQVFYKSDGTLFTAPILNDGVVFDVDRADLKGIRINDYSVSADFVPPEEDPM